ncbi:MAG: prephenate dehydrogenase/arogenate dehydrogenase family protein [Gemmataceae bacterium]|nr:prephenate dehydrogenase/arogenate dehydrogenase family protein [Gemmataceae bacterium]
MRFSVVTIVGVGLIGGSIGLGLKKRGLAETVRGLGRSRETPEKAKALGAIDEIHTDPAAALKQSQIVVLCTPVDRIAAQAMEFAALCPPGCIVTDAGSTKARIAAALDGRMPAGVSFVGSHPLAGSEKRGPEHADADLFVNRWTVLTPIAETSAKTRETIADFWQGLGSKTCEMSPEEHDRALAMTSHLPHLIASALAGCLPESLEKLTASGFRDTTRIAAGDPEVWTAIFRENRDAVLTALRTYEARLAEYRRVLETNDAPTLDRLWREGKAVRESLNLAAPLSPLGRGSER